MSVSHRLFFALRPPLRLARQFSNAAPWFDARGQALRPEHLHVTIDILDDHDTLPPTLVDTMIAAGNSVAAAPFDLAFDLAVGSRRSVALRPRRRVPGIEALRARIVAARLRAGVAERAGYRFGAHMTLGYRDGAPFHQPIAPRGWTAQDFVLIHSHVGRTRHDILALWPLSGAADAADAQGMLF